MPRPTRATPTVERTSVSMAGKETRSVTSECQCSSRHAANGPARKTRDHWRVEAQREPAEPEQGYIPTKTMQKTTMTPTFWAGQPRLAISCMTRPGWATELMAAIVMEEWRGEEKRWLCRDGDGQMLARRGSRQRDEAQRGSN